ncbi:MAG: uracil-DNA glycosylase [Cylindrospermopsis raciborskii PAMP2012]|nr:uracil-DNA glycosylase [Cylindrospermopsis raciborskii]MCZ2201151.1 uracil-DNA glycosylase [Cylindrospermopsis raciborskii PAMP2012]
MISDLKVPGEWGSVLSDELQKPYWKQLGEFLVQERRSQTIYPPESEVFSAFELTPYQQVNVLLLGQDPYHQRNQAHGLCFSVKPGVKPPPSLKNIYQELQQDLGFPIANHGYLTNWAKQGILMLNAVLTVREGQANSHKNQGWELFTDEVIRKVNKKPEPVIFVLWGGYARKKIKLIDTNRHLVIESAHPSPLSAYNGFFGSKPFSAINSALRIQDKPEIDWGL